MKRRNFLVSLFMHSITIWGINRFWDNKGFHGRKGFYWYFANNPEEILNLQGITPKSSQKQKEIKS